MYPVLGNHDYLGLRVLRMTGSLDDNLDHLGQRKLWQAKIAATSVPSFSLNNIKFGTKLVKNNLNH